MTEKRIGISIFIGALIMFAGHSALADRVYTTDEDFDLGTLVDVNHDEPNNNQLQLDSTGTSFVFVNVAASGRGTIVRIDADTGDILGEYRTAPDGRGLDPSRTSVDSFGNVWTANRDEAGTIEDVPHGSVVKIGLIIGGRRVTIDESGNVAADPAGQYLEPPFEYSTCIDRDEDGLIKTSRGLGNILPWQDVTDGVGGTDGTGIGIVEDAEDECILLYQRLADAEEAHHVSVDAENNVWVGGYPNEPKMFYKLNGNTAAVLDSFDADAIGCGGFGGLVDTNGILWSADFDGNSLLRYDPTDGTGGCITVDFSYGLGVDADGFIYSSTWSDELIVKVDPADFLIVNQFSTELDSSRADQGVAITSDNHIWVAKGFGFEVSRLDNNGNVLSIIEVGDNPTGVSVDANGRVWVTNLNDADQHVMRIDPNEGAGGLGEVDISIDLGPGAAPDNYSDMTGVVTIGEATSPEGTWTVVYDSESPGNSWGTITWNTEAEGSQPEGTTITVEVRAADSRDGLEAESFLEVFSGVPFSLTGQFVQIRATLQPDDEGNSPILSDLEIISAPEGPEDRMRCDVDENGVIDFHDIFGIYFSIGDKADGSDDPRDWDGDGSITIVDAKGCVQECTNLCCDFPDSDKHYK